MEIIITESQLTKLKEIRVINRFNTDPEESFFRLFENPEINLNEVKNIFIDYFENIVGLDIEWMDDDKFKLYLNYLQYEDDLPDGVDKQFGSPGITSGLAYHLAENLFPLMKSNHGLSYFVEYYDSFNDYWFFDSELNEFIGKFVLEPNFDFSENSFSVVYSAVDDMVIGKGYGLKMYLTILDNCNFLISDRTLSLESLNMWQNVLSKKVKVWAKIGKKFYKVYHNKKFRDPYNVEYFVGSKKENLLDSIPKNIDDIYV